MSTSEDIINKLAEQTNEKSSLHERHNEDGDDLNEVSRGQNMICTADSCSIPLNGSQDGSSLIDEKKSESENQSRGVSEPSIAPDKQNKKNLGNNKNKGGETQQAVSSILNIHTQSDLNKVLQQHNTVLLEFVTTWCTACHGIQPLYEELAEREVENNDNSDSILRAAQVVCDNNKETKKLADANGVGSYPVFILYQQGSQVSKWMGADIGKLEKAFDNYGAGSCGKRGKGGKGKKGKGRR